MLVYVAKLCNNVRYKNHEILFTVVNLTLFHYRWSAWLHVSAFNTVMFYKINRMTAGVSIRYYYRIF